MKLFDGKKIDIALVGASMAGKTTFIASLYSKAINGYLRKKCLENNSGQTKIKVFYAFEESGDLRIKNIGISKEKWNGASDEIKEKLRSFLRLTEAEEEKLKDYSRDNECELEKNLTDVSEFYDEIINSKEVMDSEVLTKVTVSGGAAEKVWKCIQELKLDEVVIRDTRGLMDETDEFEERFKEICDSRRQDKTITSALGDGDGSDREEEMMKALLNERGIVGADICMFMTSGGQDGLGLEKNRKRYGFILQEIVNNMIVAIVAQDPILTDKLTSISEEKRMDTYLEWLDQGMDENYNFNAPEIKRSSGSCKVLRELLSDNGLFEHKSPNAEYHDELMKQHFCQYLVARVNAWEEDEDIYLDTAYATFRMVLNKAVSYKKELEEFLRKKSFLLVKKNFLKAFEDYYWNCIPDGSLRRYKNDDGQVHWETDFLGYLVADMAEKIRKSLQEHNSYRGYQVENGYVFRMFGERDGLTTRIKGQGMKGKFAIDLLENAYDAIGIIGRYFKPDTRGADPQSRFSINEEVLYNSILNIVRKYSYEYLSSCTKPMLKRSLLRSVLDRLDVNKLDEETVGSATSEVIGERKRGFGDDYEDLNLVFIMLYKLIELVFDVAELNLN